MVTLTLTLIWREREKYMESIGEKERITEILELVAGLGREREISTFECKSYLALDSAGSYYWC